MAKYALNSILSRNVPFQFRNKSACTESKTDTLKLVGFSGDECHENWNLLQGTRAGFWTYNNNDTQSQELRKVLDLDRIPGRKRVAVAAAAKQLGLRNPPCCCLLALSRNTSALLLHHAFIIAQQRIYFYGSDERRFSFLVLWTCLRTLRLSP